MISFKSFLTESRSAPLYHGTSLLAAYSIVRDNKMIPHDGFIPGWLDAVSFSRSLELAKQHAKHSQSNGSLDDIIVFEVDQQKLAQNYKLKPFNFFDTKTRFLKGGPADAGSRGVTGWNEYEERVINRDITNFDRYLKKIIIFVKPGKPIKGNVILNHPKLWYNGRFVNK